MENIITKISHGTTEASTDTSATTCDSSGEETSLAKTMPEQGAVESSDDIDVPSEFLCPITQLPMRDPVIDIEGNTWERDAILDWIKKGGKSPKTDNKISEANLFPNRALRNMIADVMGADYVVVENDKTMPRAQSTNRETIDGFIRDIAKAVGKDLNLNDQGICAFTYEELTIVIEVPETVGSFFIYTSLLPQIDPSNKDYVKLMKKALLMNYLQQTTRGCCLSLDPINSELFMSYTDRITEINCFDFRNILENFIDTALNLKKELEAEQTAVQNEDANETET